MSKDNGGSAWQPIETAPKDGTIVLIWWPSLGRIFAAPFEYGKWQSGVWTKHNQPGPTHWMPLPEPPKGGDA